MGTSSQTKVLVLAVMIAMASCAFVFWSDLSSSAPDAFVLGDGELPEEDTTGDNDGIDYMSWIYPIVAVILVIAAILLIKSEHPIIGILMIVAAALILVQAYVYDIVDTVVTWFEGLRS